MHGTSAFANLLDTVHDGSNHCGIEAKSMNGERAPIIVRQ
jgi:hypothetical protein